MHVELQREDGRGDPRRAGAALDLDVEEEVLVQVVSSGNLSGSVKRMNATSPSRLRERSASSYGSIFCRNSASRSVLRPERGEQPVGCPAQPFVLRSGARGQCEVLQGLAAHAEQAGDLEAVGHHCQRVERLGRKRGREVRAEPVDPGGIGVQARASTSLATVATPCGHCL